MPYLSKKVLPLKTRETLENTFISLITETSIIERRKILGELLTPTEKLVLAKRIALISLVNKDLATFKISGDLGVSPSTVARFELAMEKGNYVHTIKWLKRNSLETKVSELLGFLIGSAFGKRGKSFGKMIKDL